MTNIDPNDLVHVTGGLEFPSAPSLSDLRSFGGGSTLGPPPSNIASAPAPRQPFQPLQLPGGGLATFGR